MRPNPSNEQARSQTTFSSRGTGTSRGSTSMEETVRSVASNLKQEQVQELLCQALETEIGGIRIYETAIECAQDEDLKEEWNKYLDETRNHERVLRECFDKMQLDPNMETPGRAIVRANGEALVHAMEQAKNSGDPDLMQITAAECVVLAETKDHMNWQLIGEVAPKMEGEARTALQEAFDEIEEQEDEHLYHTRGWARELWMQSLGLPAVLPPPEERRDVTSAIGAARAKQDRKSMVNRNKRSGSSRSKSRNTGRSTKTGGKRGGSQRGRSTKNRSRAR